MLQLQCNSMRNPTHLVAACDHALLGEEYFLRGNFNTKVASGNHDAVGGLNDLVQIRDTLLVLDFGNDQDVLTLVT